MNKTDIASVEILCCGGTIDKIYFDAKSSYQIGDPAAAEILTRARVALPPITSIIKKDSLEMDDEDRATVVKAVRESAASRLIICHGTDTMTKTAQVLDVAALEKTVVFVGAFLPAVFRDSDADFNLGFALAAATTLPAGAYIAMNGKILPAASAQKNVAAGRFEAE